MSEFLDDAAFTPSPAATSIDSVSPVVTIPPGICDDSSLEEKQAANNERIAAEQLPTNTRAFTEWLIYDRNIRTDGTRDNLCLNLLAYLDGLPDLSVILEG